jgi:NADH-quinone oxidoreductase subunit H
MISFISDPVSFIDHWLHSLLLSWGVPEGIVHLILTFFGAAIMAGLAFALVIFLIWYERKIAGRFQDRFGPNRVGPWGIAQPLADMMKIFTKEYITPVGADRFLYNLAPILTVAAVLFAWAVIPFAITIYGSNLNVGVLYFVAVGALGELGVILAGWSSNNKYALLGAFRVVAQLISYEVPMVLALLVPVLLSQSMDLTTIVEAQKPWFIVTAPVAALVFFISFNIEYSGLKFGMFFVGEFLHAFTLSIVFAILFLGGWQGPFAAQYPILGFIYLFIKTGVVYFATLLLRFSVPRFRIDQMMAINWKLLTPLSLAVLVITAIVVKLIEKVPVVPFSLILLAVNFVVGVITLELMRRWAGRARKQAETPPAPVIPTKSVSA